KPLQRPTPPIMIGASKPRALQLVAELADAWNTPEGTESYLAGREILARHCDAIGRDPATIRHIVRVNLIIDDTQAKAKERLETMLNQRRGQGYLRERTVVGTAEQCAEHFRPLIALGVTEFIAAFWEADRQAEGIERFATEVWPLLRQLA
ncbi:MAG: LLM class flavin-dependent oxidoreductase, partial [Dehalococcoidia bacterium]|nr:LLM class flavin-dependent oxidoreductase [Dehalococcoidia bacterium]